MNDQFTNNLQPEDSELSNKLNTVAEQTSIDPYFMNELEQKLKAAHKPKTYWWTPSPMRACPRWVGSHWSSQQDWC